MITIGVDAHKAIHVAMAVDETGRELANWRGPNSPAGWKQLADWVSELAGDRQWGIEGAWGNGRGLAQYLASLNETVYEINARWTAQARRVARTPAKTDRLDARAVALIVCQEAPKLPRVVLEDETVVLDLLTSERETLVVESTRIRNQLHALLLQLDSQYKSRLPSFDTVSGLDALEQYSASTTSVVQLQRAQSVRRLAQRLRLVLQQTRELAKQIRQLAADRLEPLTRVCGVNLLTAGTLAGILGPGVRFSSDSELAAYVGVSPLETSSAGLVRHRLNRGGNRRLNAILYRIVLTQAHYSPDARAYIDRRLHEGKTRREAHRCLRRFVVRSIWRLWKECCEAAPKDAFTNAA